MEKVRVHGYKKVLGGKKLKILKDYEKYRNVEVKDLPYAVRRNIINEVQYWYDQANSEYEASYIDELTVEELEDDLQEMKRYGNEIDKLKQRFSGEELEQKIRELEDSWNW